MASDRASVNDKALAEGSMPLPHHELADTNIIGMTHLQECAIPCCLGGVMTPMGLGGGGMGPAGGGGLGPGPAGIIGPPGPRPAWSCKRLCCSNCETTSGGTYLSSCSPCAKLQRSPKWQYPSFHLQEAAGHSAMLQHVHYDLSSEICTANLALSLVAWRLDLAGSMCVKAGLSHAAVSARPLHVLT